MSDKQQSRMFLTCYTDTHGYGWKHVDLFVHDADGKEVNWVHWGVEADGPDAADAATARIEPTLTRVTDWKREVSQSGMEYWTAEAEWAAGSGPSGADGA